MSKKEDRKKLFFGIFIVFLMITSTLGFIYSGDDMSTKQESGLKFVKTEVGTWRTYIDSIESYWDFTYLPSELNQEYTQAFDLDTEKVYLYAESFSDKQFINKFRLVFLYKNIVVKEATVLNCSSEDKIYVLDSSGFSISTNENCIFLNGNLNKYLDGLTYKVFGVI